jgi:hypothetical protein
MPSDRSVVTLTTQPETRAVQVQLAISLRRRRSQGRPDAPVAYVPESSGRPRLPRITRLMALAIKFQDMVDRGEVRDYADIANLGYVTRARLTQIMNLLLLAPDIQEAILALKATGTGDEVIAERHVRHIVVHPSWQRQRSEWIVVNGRQNEWLCRPSEAGLRVAAYPHPRRTS